MRREKNSEPSEAMQVIVPASVAAQVRELAAAQKRTVSLWLRLLVERELARRTRGRQP